MWSAAEDVALRIAVQRYGRRWRKIAANVPALSARTPHAMRQYWDAHSHAPPPTFVVQPVSQLSTHAVSWPPFPGSKRDRKGGRPWSFFVGESCLSRRAPTARQSLLLSNWGLMDVSPVMLLCNLQRAEAIVRSYLLRLRRPCSSSALQSTHIGLSRLRRLGAVYAARDTCHTLTSSNSNLYWALLPGRPGAFLDPSALASFMGMGRSGRYAIARRLIPSDYTLSYCIAESVHARLAKYCASSAMQLAGASLSSIGSLYSGAFDALAEGFSDNGVYLARLFAAESNSTNRQVLMASYHYQYLFYTAQKSCSGQLQRRWEYSHGTLHGSMSATPCKNMAIHRTCVIKYPTAKWVENQTVQRPVAPLCKIKRAATNC